MKSMGRRKFLRVASASPIAARLAGADMAMQMTGVKVGKDVSVPYRGGPEPQKMFDFSTWLRSGRLNTLKERSKRITFIDPDLASLSLPLTTLTRIQCERNLQRMVAEEKNWFEQKLKKAGFVEVYDD